MLAGHLAQINSAKQQQQKQRQQQQQQQQQQRIRQLNNKYPKGFSKNKFWNISFPSIAYYYFTSIFIYTHGGWKATSIPEREEVANSPMGGKEHLYRTSQR